MTSRVVDPVEIDETMSEPATDARWAQRFADAHCEMLRFPHSLGYWLLYQAPLWRRDLDGEVVRLAIAFARVEQSRALVIEDRRARETAVKEAISRESKVALDRTLSIAHNLQPVTDKGDGWDADEYLLGTPNVIVDLRTGDPLESAPALKGRWRQACRLSAMRPVRGGLHSCTKSSTATLN